MTKENVFVKHLLEFLLGLVKVCVFMALMTGTFVASAFLAIQGVSVIRDTYGFHGLAIAWAISFTILVLVCGLFEEKRKQGRARRARSEAHTENDQQGPKDENETYERCTSDKARSVEVCSS